MMHFVIGDPMPGLPQLINCVTETRLGPGFQFQTNDMGHQPRRCVIQLTLEGLCSCSSDEGEQWHDIRPGQAVAFIQPLENISVAYPPPKGDPLRIMLVGFSGQTAETLLSEIRGDHPVVDMPLNLEPIKRLRHWLPPAGSSRKRVDARTSAQIIWDLLGGIASAKRAHLNPKHQLVSEAMDIMLANLATVTIDQVALELNTNRMQLNRYFHEMLDCAPGQWLRQQKLSYIQDLLRDPKLGLEEIAIRSGYSNATALIASFQSAYGITPRQWRDNAV